MFNNGKANYSFISKMLQAVVGVLSMPSKGNLAIATIIILYMMY